MDLNLILDDFQKKIKEEKVAGISSFSGSYQKEELEIWKQKLLKHFSNLDLSQYLAGQTKFNSRGRYYLVSQSYKILLQLPGFERCKEWLLSNLTFLEGIREITQSRLRSKGFHKISDLVSHPRFSQRAEKAFRILELPKLKEAVELCRSRFARTHPVYLYLAGICSLEEFLFLDLETLGLFSGNALFLIGLAKVDEEGVRIFQYLARFPQEESAILQAALEIFNKSKVLISYNGKTFDFPYLLQRACLWNLSVSQPLLHLDLLHFLRRSFKSSLSGFKLSEVEAQLFGKRRELDLPGEYVPFFYREYLKTRQESYLVPILLHNARDLLALVRLLNMLYQQICG